VLDVGGGYGAVTRRVLQAFPRAAVTLHDYSPVMFDQARDNLSDFAGRVRYARADLRDPAWTAQVGGPFDLAVSALCIHNTLDLAVIARCYRDVGLLLKPGGCFLDYDHYDHIETIQFHLDLFAQAGYARVESLWYESPTALIRAWA
jgi:SAM-dependent methyltransferase